MLHLQGELSKLPRGGARQCGMWSPLKSLSLSSGSCRIWAGTTVHFVCSTLHFVHICLEAGFQALNTSFLCKRIIWVIGLQRTFSTNGFDLLKESEWEFCQKQMHSRDIYYCPLAAGDFALVCFIHLIKNSLEPCKEKISQKRCETQHKYIPHTQGGLFFACIQ